MLHSVDEANRLIMAGKRLHIAGDAAALARLGRGDWIGGTIPYFLTAEGGQADRKRVFVTELPPEVGGGGDRFEFAETGFAAQRCRINGANASFYEYVKTQVVDLRRPLVTDMSGEMINVSFQAIDDATRSVRLYAPVLAGAEYRQAAPLDDYRGSLLEHVAANPVTPVFSCNCILNYLYADLAGDKALSITGPATFGEIAYVLLNQTLVYLELAA
jgi:hypothetical protein